MSGHHQAQTNEHLEQLRTVPFFRGLPESEMEGIAALCQRLDLPANCNVFYEGDRGDSMFALISGEVSIYKTSDDGTVVEIVRLQEGTVFGHFALLDQRPRSASINVVSDATLLQIRQRDFQALANKNRDVLWYILGGLATILSEYQAAEMSA